MRINIPFACSGGIHFFDEYLTFIIEPNILYINIIYNEFNPATLYFSTIETCRTKEVNNMKGGRMFDKKRILSSLIAGLIVCSVIAAVVLVSERNSSSSEEPENPNASEEIEPLNTINFVEISTGLPAGTYNFVTFGDFNGDPFVDMAFGAEDYSGGIQGLYAYTGDGGTSWSDASTGLPGLGSSTFGGLAFGDADDDGIIELYAGYEHWGTGPDLGVGAWEYTGGAWTTAGITSPYTSGGVDNLVLTNVTGNSGLDLVIATDNGLRYYEGNGSSPISWTEHSVGLPNFMEFTGLAVADMNKDGLKDIVAGTYNNAGVRFYTQDPSGTSWTVRPGGGLPASGSLFGVALGDVNKDSHMDIVYAIVGGGLHVLLGNSGEPTGTNFIWQTPPLPGEGFPASGQTGSFAQLQLADFDKDNDLDLLAPKTSGGLRLYLSNGSMYPGPFLGWTELVGAGLPPAGVFYGSNYADIDNDGDLDVGGVAWNGFGAHAWRNDLTFSDTEPPYALTWSPLGAGVPVNTDFTVEWNETMNWNSVNISFSYTDSITTWYASDGTFIHDPVANISVFNPTVDLSPGVTYMVMFDTNAADPNGNLLDQDQDKIAGEIGQDELTWTFTTMADNPPNIDAYEPGGFVGQSFTQGEIVAVTWETSDDNPLPPNPINISYGSGVLWTPIANDEADDGLYLWDTSAVPCPFPYEMNISVYDSIGQTTFDESNESFMINCVADTPPLVEAWEPGGFSGQSFIQGALVDVTWNASDDNPLPANPINITYGAGAVWTPVANDEANDGYYQWDTAAVPCPAAYSMNISAYDSIGQATYDESNFTFNVFCPGDSPPVVDAYEPGATSGQIIIMGDVVQVTWNASDDNALPPNPINITYGTPGSWTDIALNEANDGAYSWDTTGVPCPNTYWMNISVYDSAGQTTFDESNYSFLLLCVPDDPPNIDAYEPGGFPGQIFTQGDIIAVTWETSDDNPLPPNPINITYGSGVLWTPIANDEADDGLYLWDTSGVPCPSSYQMNISVYDSMGQTTFDEGNNTFFIDCPDTISPQIISTNPANDTSGVPLTEQVIIEFNEPIDTTTFDYTIFPDPGGWMWNWNPGNTNVTGLHIVDFAPDTTYTFNVINANDTSGNQLGPGTVPNPWIWTTVALDTIAPSISGIGTSPSNPYITQDVTVSATITDASGAVTVRITVTDPDGNVIADNVTMPAGAGVNEFTLTVASSDIDVEGTYSFTIWANDSSGNYNSTSETFMVSAVTINYTLTVSVWESIGLPITGAAVVIKDDGGTEVASGTTISGFYKTPTALSGGNYTVTVSKSGYKTATKDVELTGPDSSIEVQVILEEEQKIFWLLLILLIIMIVIVVLILLIFILKRRKKGAEPDVPLSEAQQGESPAAVEGQPEESQP
jgi:flagellar basal body-associated protein FliL